MQTATFRAGSAARRCGWLSISMCRHSCTEIRRAKVSFCVGCTSVLVVVRAPRHIGTHVLFAGGVFHSFNNQPWYLITCHCMVIKFTSPK